MGLARRKQKPHKRSVLRKSCTFIEIFFRNRLTKSRRDGKIYRQSAVAVKIESGRVPEWPMGTDCKSAAFSFGGSNPPAPTKRSSIRTGCWIFCFVETFSGLSGRIRTAAALSQKTAQKQPGGLFLAARLATSTRAHQEIQYPNRVLDFLFCRNFFRAERADSNSIGPSRTVRRAKKPQWGFFRCAARESTRAHQEIQHPNRVLDFLFCGNFFRAGREEGKCEKQSPVLAQARWVC